ncbi:LysR family transcriptional regulator [Alterisphingorhabdus coralli]|uniref:LysR family transcriptional regulator n=1 Tax=Alterisphingorhabdus coralli TaxID=3071408 RepID=A0AA97F8R9_9SPHN|nr:LysR family transcriptional regulator [Parasphingorhabdus sp. SCSIO 66989]WOE76048.1 LysR family transcriptional regulator [Parasphingorhabdus sp. SCSIO 66989]
MDRASEQLFLRVVETGSLKAAAEQIGADPSAVSRKIAGLEQRLGVKLLQRSTKRSTPTEAGEQYYRGMRQLVDAQASLEAEVTGMVDTPTGLLRVTAPVDFGARFVTPVLSDLQEDYPDLCVELLLGSSFSDLREQGIDVAVRIGQLPDSSLIARRLGAVPRVLVASPDYLSRHGAPSDPEELSDHRFVFYRPGQRDEKITLQQGDATKSITVSGSFSANSITAIRALVVAGRGIHLGPHWAFEKEIASGEVVCLFENFQLPAYPLHTLYIAGGFVPAKVRTFIDRMAKAVRQSLVLD